MTIDSDVRLNKFISDSGYCSRREADRLIENNRVKINGKRSELGSRVRADDEVTVDGMAIQGSAQDKSDRIYVAYNKPVGVTCTTDQSVEGNIVDAIDHDERIFPIGRLDKPSEGLILLTSDGDIVNKILRAENNHEKEYLVTVNRNLETDFAGKMSKGVPILDTVTKYCKVIPHGRSGFKIILTEGLNRQIRRMCEYFGYEVKTLKRLRIMNIELGRLKPGQWRNLTRNEMAQLNTALAGVSGEAPVKKVRPSSGKRKPASRTGERAKYPDKKASYFKKPAKKKTTSSGKKIRGKSVPGNAPPKKGGKPARNSGKPR